MKPRTDGFTDTEYLCVGIVDIPDSATVIASIHQRDKLRKYHVIFINTMEAIARNFGAEAVKSEPNKVIFFFPKTESSSDKTAFKDVLKCGLAMQTAHDDMNQKYYEEDLPPITR